MGDLSFLDSNVVPRLRRVFHETVICRGHLGGGPPEEPERPEFESHLCHLPAMSVHTKSLQSCPILATLWTVACQAPLSMGFSSR